MTPPRTGTGLSTTRRSRLSISWQTPRVQGTSLSRPSGSMFQMGWWVQGYGEAYLPRREYQLPGVAARAGPGRQGQSCIPGAPFGSSGTSRPDGSAVRCSRSPWAKRHMAGERFRSLTQVIDDTSNLVILALPDGS